MKIQFTIVAICFAAASMFAQAPTSWFHQDYATTGYPGVNSIGAYELLKGKTSQPVIVAVIDGGVDINHEDLKDILWVNTGEIAGNGIDDDNNGYVDDIHGWNFIGGKDGRNVGADTYEATRLLAKYQAQFSGRDPKTLKGQEKKEYEVFQKLLEDISTKIAEAKLNLSFIEPIYNSYYDLKEKLNAKGYTQLTDEAINSLKGNKSDVEMAKALKEEAGEDGLELFVKEYKSYVEYFKNQVEYSYNPRFDTRDIVGDNYANSAERIYGNNDIKGPDASHGSHVSGIIAAKRNNGIGMDGIADNVRIMGIRCVPDGDERDKDVANAIRYAVDNGAKIINMSFGKAYSWDKKTVDEAVKYAESKGVLLIHAAGNEANNIDKSPRYPTKNYEAGGSCSTWIEVGALNWEPAPNVAADFSNFGKKNVDLFAPGVDIYSTTPEDQYASFGGTSMAAPVVAGCAAVLMSYFPTLTAIEVKNILRNSVMPYNVNSYTPGTSKTTKFKSLSNTGGVVNLYNAVKMAMNMK